MRKLSRIWKKIVCVAGISLLTLLLGACSEKEKILFQETTELFQESETQELSGQSKDRKSTLICVDVAGAVKHPGVVKLSYGARVYQAIEKAGGFSEEAAVSSVNQAAELEDGQQLYVCTLEEQQLQLQQAEGNPADAQQEEVKININKASAEELMTLPGIGQSKAEDILRFREENGSFQQIEDIMNISGIKEAVFGKIKDKITV